METKGQTEKKKNKITIKARGDLTTTLVLQPLTHPREKKKKQIPPLSPRVPTHPHSPPPTPCVQFYYINEKRKKTIAFVFFSSSDIYYCPKHTVSPPPSSLSIRDFLRALRSTPRRDVSPAVPISNVIPFLYAFVRSHPRSI